MIPILLNRSINRVHRTYTKPQNNSSSDDNTPFYQNKIVRASFLIGICLIASRLPITKRFIKENNKLQKGDSFTPINSIPKPEVPVSPINKPKSATQPKPATQSKKTTKKYNTQLNISEEERLSIIFSKHRSAWCKNGLVSPQEIDKILTKQLGAAKKREIKFTPDIKRGIFIGRKVSYKRKGSIFVLEAHDGPKGIETRCYMTMNNYKPLSKEERLYLCTDGIFEPGTYYAGKTHLKSVNSAVDWINQANLNSQVS